ncbi:phage tail sheath family protein [Tumebacillus permanentifrigoris]|uniref:Tail sheath protein C-terminal domain-containing protein n=1 Tax=Tumebacillus permanentifrigoris TaxID=378543 RepID=A0A316D7W7_9BACL|nr:phage tail sheath subtilisin-like domain-containing protein [Tumebacillus permanentifrigoris]PWK11521.1 hypothetical protein C7459_11050 [Tumebacillus permanentifrigoris]
MPEYLTPGVYVEEFDSGSVPLEGASTSTAGFIGLAERGPSKGMPELVTGFHDFRRIYGSYLSKAKWEEFRFLAYAVENFFLNGGSRAYIMRVVPENAAPAANFDTKLEDDKLPETLLVEAKNEGVWGNQIQVIVRPDSKAKSAIKAVVDAAAFKYQLKNSSGFNAGDIVLFEGVDGAEPITIVSVQDDVIQLSAALPDSPVDEALPPTKVLKTCEFSVAVKSGDEVEFYEQVSLNREAPNHVDKLLAKSNLIYVKDNFPTFDPAKPLHPYSVVSDGKDAKEKDTTFAISLTGGSDGSYESIKADPKRYTGVDDSDPSKRTGLQAFLNNEVVSIMAVPGVTDKNVQVDLVAHCEKTRNRVAILDVPLELVKPDDILTKHRDLFDTSFAAMYGPWLQVFDPLDKRNIFIPPSGSVAGIYARSDSTRGVSKAPANEVVRGCTGLSTYYNNGAQDILNPKGVNLIRSFPGQGIRVWGARTLSSNGLWKYVNVRRLFIFVEESIRRGTNWIVFEPNDEPLWARVQRTIDVFLTGVWRSGALMGASPAEAYYIKIGRATMTQDDIDNGRLICEIGISPTKPAEFVIFRFTQKTNDAQ